MFGFSLVVFVDFVLLRFALLVGITKGGGSESRCPEVAPSGRVLGPAESLESSGLQEGEPWQRQTCHILMSRGFGTSNQAYIKACRCCETLSPTEVTITLGFSLEDGN